MQMSVTTTNNYNTESPNTVYIGMDVHKDSFTLSAFTMEMKEPKHIVKVSSDYKQILKYIERMRTFFGEDAKFICGYEAGCLGYSLYNNLATCGIECKIMAPTTMMRENDRRVKTDSRDACLIARCLAFHTYHEVYVPTEEIVEVKEYLRMRNCHKNHLKKIKQQILAFCLREGIHYGDGGNWTIKHLAWLKKCKLSPLLREILDEYLITLDNLTNKVERLDKRIAEIAARDQFADRVQKLCCLRGIQTHTAMTAIAEIGDFNRFATAEKFSAFLGLVPGESSSGDPINRLGITKAGNNTLRTLLAESAHSLSRGSVGYKSKALKKQQEGQPPKFIAYIDKANERLQKRFYVLMFKGKKYNIASIAVARELACFIWGVMTEQYNKT